MNILHVIATLDKRQGGPPPVVTGMCAALAARGHEVTLYANQSLSPFLPQQDAPFRLEYFQQDWGPYAVSLAMARRLHNLRGFDIVHIHMLYRFPQAMAAYEARRQAIPYCLQPHGALAPGVYRGKRRVWRQAYMELIERRNIEKSAAMLFTAQREQEWACELGLVAPYPRIVPVGANIDCLSRRADGAAFRARHGIGGALLLLWIGRLVESKGLALLLAAFAAALVVHPGMKVVIAGPDTNNYLETLRALVDRLGIAAHVIFTGMIGGEEKQQALCAADLFALPSESENFGLAALEAMAVGCPVLLSPGVAIAQAVADAGAGRIVPREAPHWQEAISSVMADGPRRAAMGAAAAMAARRYDWSVVTGELESVYFEMAARQ